MPAAPLQPPPRTCAIFSMSTSEASCHWRDLSRAATHRELRTRALGGHQFSFLLLMIFDSSSMKLLISLNCRYTEANRT